MKTEDTFNFSLLLKAPPVLRPKNKARPTNVGAARGVLAVVIPAQPEHRKARDLGDYC